jgi:hypothetical protein
MSPARTQRLTAIGTLCRRPSVLLLPLAPFVFITFALIAVGTIALQAMIAARSGLRARAAARRVVADDLDSRGERPRTASRPTPIRILGGAAALMGGVLIAASMAGGTYAFLNAQGKTSTATVSSGSLAITVQAAGTTAGATTAIPTAAWSNMLPGDFAGQQVTVVNTGNVTVNATARLTATTPWDIRIVVGTCPTTQMTSAALTTAAVGYGTLAPGASAVVCVQATLPATSTSENTSANFSIIIDATQVAS